jgi:ketosteroid isomerase-like protein
MMTPDDSSIELAETAAQFAEAIVSNDADRIASFLDPEWRLIDADGITTRKRFLDLVRSGVLTHSVMQPIGALDIRVNGDVGLVVARVLNTAHYNGAVFDADEWTTDVFVRRHERWLCVHSHVTPASTAAP